MFHHLPNSMMTHFSLIFVVEMLIVFLRTLRVNESICFHYSLNFDTKMKCCHQGTIACQRSLFHCATYLLFVCFSCKRIFVWLLLFSTRPLKVLLCANRSNFYFLCIRSNKILNIKGMQLVENL